VRLAEHQAARAPLDKEREGIAAMREALAAERVQVQAASDKAVDFRTRMEAHAARVAQWNRDVENFNNSNPKGPFGERERVRINTEREALQKASTEFEAERVAMAAGNDKLIAAYNANAKALEARVAEWNQRNQAWNQAGTKLESERQDWVDACADRRYREDDEIAIKAGK
jgi:predicted  nucleic acid-binding Zn-ribbon protein